MKLFYNILFLLLVSCSGQVSKSEILVNALNNPSLPMRGNLVEVSPNEYRLDYYDIHEKDSHYRFLEERGYHGGGPSWLGIVFGAIQMSDPSLQTRIRFDDEADGLAIWSSDKASLEKIGRLISVVKANDSILLQAIQVAENSWQME